MKNKLFRDSVHGYIEIPEIIVSEIIDTPIFQRLRQIEQTSMRALYPSAHHDRFVHSLGVFHLGKLAYFGLINNIKDNTIYTEYKSFWAHYGVCFELACLLHDCAHAPMSHSFEYGYLNTNDSIDCRRKKDLLLNSMKNEIGSNTPKGEQFISQLHSDIDSYFKIPQKIAPHEMVSAIIVGDYFRKKGCIRRILETLLGEQIDVDELAEYTSFMQRAIIGLPYSDLGMVEGQAHIEMCFKNCLISLLNGNFFDVDKLDYIVRDTVESGANNLTIDIPRILNALTLVEIHHFETDTDISNLELNNSIYFTGCNSTVQDKAEVSDCECALNMTGVHLKGKFQGTLCLEGIRNTLITQNAHRRGECTETFSDLTEIDAVIDDKGKMTGRFNGQIEVLGHSLTDRVDGVISAKISGKIMGTIIGHIDAQIGSKLTYAVGYLKNALSVIEDTLIARNRLYLWIYAHHKVTYNDYLLRHGILYSLLNESHSSMGEYEKHKKADELLVELMDISKMYFEENHSESYLLSDGDLIHKMKMSIVKPDHCNPFADQWLSRKHMYPVWKSYVEYNNFFANLSGKERKKIWNLLFNGTEQIPESELPTEANSDEFENSILCTFSDEYKYAWIKPAGFKLKELDVSNIYIVLSDNSVKRLVDVITQAKVTEQYVDESFFYLYTSEKFDPDKKLQLISYLKTATKRK